MKHGVATLTFFVLIVMMTNAQQPTLVLEGYATDDHYGEVVRKAGDVDLDGVCDFVVTASQRFVPDVLGITICAGGGFAEVRSGLNGSPIHTFSFPGATMFGRSAHAGKDFDGDGVPDIVVGTSQTLPAQCMFMVFDRVTVFSGATGAVLLDQDDLVLLGMLISGTSWRAFAHDVLLIDDVSGDGLADVVVSWSALSGGCEGGFIILDRFGSVVTLFQCPGTPSFPAGIGPDIDDVGDIDGNGFTDILVNNGANGFVIVDGSTGAVTTAYTTAVFPNRPNTPGHSSGAIGDVNGDGTNDYFTAGVLPPAAVAQGQGLGEVFVFSGADDTILWSAHSDEEGTDFMGTDVATQGDFDGDGIDDYAAGAPQPRYLTDRSGYVRVWSGATGAVLATIPSPSTNAEFGNSIDFLDDIDGDGRDDLVIGAWRADTSLGTQAGAAYVYTAADVLDVNNSSACAAGNVDVTGGGPFDVLTVNGSAGSTIQRQVGVGLDEPITFAVDAPPGGPTAPIFVLFGRFGLAPLSELFATPFGDFCLLPSLFASPFSGRFILAGSTGSAGLSLFPPAGPAPWNRTVFAGVPFPVQITLQALIQSTTAPNGFAISNAVVASIY